MAATTPRNTALAAKRRTKARRIVHVTACVLVCALGLTSVDGSLVRSSNSHNDGDILSLQSTDHNDGLSAAEGLSIEMPTKPLLDKYRELALEDSNVTDTLIERLDLEDEDFDPADGLAVVVTFEEILRLIVFFAAAWIMSNLSSALGMPGLVGEIITGFLLGPPLADFCPFPEAIVMIGNVGLIGLMLESGKYYI